MKTLDLQTLRSFLDLAGNRLRGDWVLMGGTVLPLMGAKYRVTTDIDLVALDDQSQAQTIQLMEIAEELGLPVETINQAGALFLKRIPGFRDHLTELHKGSSATIYRPDIALFLSLKTKRLTESDLADCLEYLKETHRKAENWDRNGLLAIVQSELNAKPGMERAKRLRCLLKTIQATK